MGIVFFAIAVVLTFVIARGWILRAVIEGRLSVLWAGLLIGMINLAIPFAIEIFTGSPPNFVAAAIGGLALGLGAGVAMVLFGRMAVAARATKGE